MLYTVVSFASLTDDMKANCIEGQPGGAFRHTTSGEDKVICKGELTHPCWDGCDKLTHTEALAEVQKPEWEVE